MTAAKPARPAADPADTDREEPVALAFPHLLIREANAFLALFAVLAVVSILANAPLEEMANPLRTPNPAKAPWYFLGLQELLHYFPPFVSGVLLPGLSVVALAVIPYFQVNQRNRPWLNTNRRTRLGNLWGVVSVLSLVMFFAGAHPAWALLIPTWLMAGLASLGAVDGLGRPGRWLRGRSMPFWVFTWFLLVSAVLIIIGVYFRGPGWSFTLPWRDGVF